MLGPFRFALACLVLLSHIPQRDIYFNFGMVAVTLFYFISGRLMQRSFFRFQDRPSPMASFYLDRLVRLYPAYVLALMFAAAAAAVVGAFPPQFSFGDLLANLTLLPLPYERNGDLALIQPAWSLGAEAHFYLIVPLLFAMAVWVRRSLLISLAALHVLVLATPVTLMALGFHQTGFLYWDMVSSLVGYRWPVFMAAVFGLGWLAAEGQWKAATIVWGLYAFLFLVLGPATGVIRNAAAAEVALGVMLCPLALAVERLKPADLSRAADYMGRMAYPLFLVHYPCIKLAEAAAGAFGGRPVLVLCSWLFSLTAAGLLMLLDAPLTVFRYRFRGFGGRLVPG